MKKNLSFRLKRETLRRLDAAFLSEPAGGTSAADTSCVRTLWLNPILAPRIEIGAKDR